MIKALSDEDIAALLERVEQDGSDVLVRFDGGRSKRIVCVGANPAPISA
jgi:hypothetical protein